MSEVTIRDRGRIIIPKELREKASLRSGEKMRAEEKDGEIVLTPMKGKEAIKDLKGCIEESEIDPMDVKNIWEE